MSRICGMIKLCGADRVSSRELCLTSPGHSCCPSAQRCLILGVRLIRDPRTTNALMQTAQQQVLCLLAACCIHCDEQAPASMRYRLANAMHFIIILVTQ